MNALKLFVLQHQGQSQNYVWEWPEHQSTVCFDGILSGLQAVHASQLDQAQHCTLACVGSPQNPVWVLANNSAEIVCSVNQDLLAAGSRIRVNHGDEIELGFTRLVVSLDGSTETATAEDQGAAPSSTAADNHFKLTDLDPLTDITRLAEHGRHGLDRASFSDLISLSPEDAAPNHPEKASDLLAQFDNRQETVPKDEVPVADLLDALHAQYLDKLRNPAQAVDNGPWQQDLERLDQTKQGDPMGHWMRQAGNTHSLDDLLGQQRSIASVLNHLDSLSTSNILEPQPFDSVMQLFAPAHLRTENKNSLEAVLHRSLPSITQREHHSLSLDSVMPFTGGEEPPPKQAKSAKP